MSLAQRRAEIQARIARLKMELDTIEDPTDVLMEDVEMARAAVHAAMRVRDACEELANEPTYQRASLRRALIHAENDLLNNADTE